MWIVVAGTLTNEVVRHLNTYIKNKTFQGVHSVIDITNTIFTKGIEHFEPVEGIMVLSSGCESIVDMGWALQLNRLNKPVLYYSTYELKDSAELESLTNVEIQQGTKISLRDLVKGINEHGLRQEIRETLPAAQEV